MMIGKAPASRLAAVVVALGVGAGGVLGSGVAASAATPDAPATSVREFSYSLDWMQQLLVTNRCDPGYRVVADSGNSSSDGVEAIEPGGIHVVAWPVYDDGDQTGAKIDATNWGFSTQTLTIKLHCEVIPVELPVVELPVVELPVGWLHLSYTHQFPVPDGASLRGIDIPAGLEFDSTTGVLSGMPTTPGEYSFAIVASYEDRDETQPVRLNVSRAGWWILSGEVFEPFSYQVAMPEGAELVATYDPPAGLTFDESTGVLSGVPMKSGYFDFDITTRINGEEHTVPYDLHISAAADPNQGGYQP